MHVHVDFVSHEFVTADLFALAERMRRERILGWCSCGAETLHGRIVCLNRERPRAMQIVSEHLNRAEMTVVTATEILPGGLKDFYVFPKRKGPSEAKVTIEKVGHRGEIHGWAYDPKLPHQRLLLSIAVDAVAVAQVVADIFRLDLLKAGLGDGACGFSAHTDGRFVDGSRHDIQVTAFDPNEPSRDITSARKTLHFPQAFTVGAPSWRSPNALNAFERLKHRTMSSGLDSDMLAELRNAIEDQPDLVFSDAGIVEASKRLGKPFPSFRERLAHRFESVDCPKLVRAFCSKAFTKQYALERRIRVPETFLVTASLEQISNFNFPDRFAIKPVKDSGASNILYDRGVDLLSRRPISLPEIFALIAEYQREKPDAEFIIEEALRQKGAREERAIPLDYKLHVFGGKVRLIHVDDRNVFQSRDPLYRQQGWYSANWKPAPFRMRVREEEAIDFCRPQSLSELIRLAEAIGNEAGDYVRVDLYDTDMGIMLGEVTTFSHEGLGFTDYGDLVLSQAWTISPRIAASVVLSPT